MSTTKAGDQKFLQNWNRNIVLNMIYEAESISRVEIAKKTNLSQSTVTGIINILKENGYVMEVGTGKSTKSGGRRPTFLTINPEKGYIIGMAIITEAYHITLQLSLFNLALEPVYEAQHIIKERGIKLMDSIIKVITDLKKEYADENIVGLGISIPTVLDQDGVIHRGHLLELEQFPIKNVLNKEFPSLNILIEQEQHAALHGEKLQPQAADVKDLVYVTVGRGIGSSVMVNNKLIRGAHGGAGEIGHMSINKFGEKCICGKKGCVRLYCTELAFINTIKEAVEQGHKVSNKVYNASLNQINVLEVYKEAINGDEFCMSMLKVYADNLSLVFSNLIYIFNPEMIVLGGNILYAEEFVIPYIRESLGKIMDYSSSEVDIVAAKLKDKSAIYGVANMVHNTFFLNNEMFAS